MCEKTVNNGNRSKQEEAKTQQRRSQKKGDSSIYVWAVVSFLESHKIFWAQQVGSKMFLIFD